MTPISERKTWTAKAPAICSYDLCPHAGKIRVGEAIAWNRSQAGIRYHADCFLKVKGVDVTTISKRNNAKVPVVVPFDVEETKDLVATLETTLELPATDELRHKLYSLLREYISERAMCYLWGAPGSGKSFVCWQVAEELGLTFATITVNPKSPASLLFGYLDMNGLYRETDLYRAYRDGGVFLFDELDNCDSAMLTLLNGILATPINKQASFPCGMVTRNPNFVFLAAGNTNGRGPNYQFPQRQKIDESNIDRLTFIGWDYDCDLEMAIALKINATAGAWVRWVQDVRAFAAIKSNGITGGLYTSARAIAGIARDVRKIGRERFSVAEIIERHVFKGTSVDMVNRILTNVPTPR